MVFAQIIFYNTLYCYFIVFTFYLLSHILHILKIIFFPFDHFVGSTELALCMHILQDNQIIMKQRMQKEEQWLLALCGQALTHFPFSLYVN
jgi:hypothetical protein